MPDPAADLNPPARLLLGPGPSNVHPRVLQALTSPTLGYLDPDFLDVLTRIQELLRGAFRTRNPLTLALSGTGTSGMEAGLVNLLEPGEKALVCVNGYFGARLVEVALRAGAQVIRVEAPWGRVVEPEAVEAELRAHPDVKLVALVQGETSTGVLQPVKEIADLAHRHGALVLVDAVTSFGGCELPVDAWDLDYVYSCTQKCLSCPSGLSPITVSERARRAIGGRERRIGSFYLDLTLLEQYWGEAHIYHHTVPGHLLYALHEALRLLAEEGVEERWARHRRHGEALQAGLAAMGLALHAQEGHRLPVLTTVRVPEGVDDARVRRRLLQEYGIEIGGGLGELRGRVWRIGLMGYASRPENVLLVLTALEAALAAEGYRAEPGAGAAAAARALA
ncbi:MAG TPA: alanine--glyoxylate aminotransferase family protein [Dehalococcoidia bacterium]